jgi:hypothetical protein
MANTIYLETADAIGTRLCRDAIWSGERCNRLGDSMEFVESRWQVQHRLLGPLSSPHTENIPKHRNPSSHPIPMPEAGSMARILRHLH